MTPPWILAASAGWNAAWTAIPPFSVATKMLPWHMDVMDGAGDLYSALGWAYAIGKGRPSADYNAPVPVFSACAGAALYRREYLEKTGLLDEIHFAYLEDVDLGYRARILGYKTVTNPLPGCTMPAAPPLVPATTPFKLPTLQE